MILFHYVIQGPRSITSYCSIIFVFICMTETSSLAHLLSSLQEKGRKKVQGWGFIIKEMNAKLYTSLPHTFHWLDLSFGHSYLQRELGNIVCSLVAVCPTKLGGVILLKGRRIIDIERHLLISASIEISRVWRRQIKHKKVGSIFRTGSTQEHGNLSVTLHLHKLLGTILFTTTTNMPSFPPRFIFLFFSFLLFLFLFFLCLCYFLSCFSCFWN